MSIQFFEDITPTDGDLDFAADFLKQNPKLDGKDFTITEINLARSGKGYMAKTDSFICWLWRKNKPTMQLLEALEAYVANQHGYRIVAVLDKKVKDGFRLGVDFDCPQSWFMHGEKKSFATQDIWFSPTGVSQSNPFLPPALQPPITGQMSDGEQTDSPQSTRRSRKTS